MLNKTAKTNYSTVSDKCCKYTKIRKALYEKLLNRLKPTCGKGAEIGMCNL